MECRDSYSKTLIGVRCARNCQKKRVCESGKRSGEEVQQMLHPERQQKGARVLNDFLIVQTKGKFEWNFSGGSKQWDLAFKLQLNWGQVILNLEMLNISSERQTGLKIFRGSHSVTWKPQIR